MIKNDFLCELVESSSFISYENDENKNWNLCMEVSKMESKLNYNFWGIEPEVQSVGSWQNKLMEEEL